MHESQITRLNKIEGQIRGIKKMISDERYCVDILTQIRSANRALAKVKDNIFQCHLEACVHDSLSGDDPSDRSKKIDEIIELLSMFR